MSRDAVCDALNLRGTNLSSSLSPDRPLQAFASSLTEGWGYDQGFKWLTPMLQ